MESMQRLEKNKLISDTGQVEDALNEPKEVALPRTHAIDDVPKHKKRDTTTFSSPKDVKRERLKALRTAKTAEKADDPKIMAERAKDKHSERFDKHPWTKDARILKKNLGVPKKGGGGRGTVWGTIDSVVENAKEEPPFFLDENDPNYPETDEQMEEYEEILNAEPKSNFSGEASGKCNRYDVLFLRLRL